jgi:hypothetical protein
MMNSDLSVHHKNNNLKVVVAFANFLGFPVVEEYQYGNLTMYLWADISNTFLTIYYDHKENIQKVPCR